MRSRRIPGVFPQCEERLVMVIKSNKREGGEPREMVEPSGGKPRANERKMRDPER